jgi:hypothetical protein
MSTFFILKKKYKEAYEITFPACASVPLYSHFRFLCGTYGIKGNKATSSSQKLLSLLNLAFSQR